MAATNASKVARAKNDVIADSKDILTDAKDVAVDVKELVEDAVDYAEVRVSWLSKNPKAVAIAALAAGVVVGSAATFLVVKKKLEAKAERRISEEVEAVKNHYSAIHKTDNSLADMAASYSDENVEANKKVDTIIAREGYTAYEKVPAVTEDPVVVAEDITVTQAIVEATQGRDRNIFESDEPDSYFDFDEEIAYREENPDLPHVITKDEYSENETNADQTELTYYEGDDVLTDAQDRPIEDKEAVVGYRNLTRFGHGSGDPQVVYIRNTRLDTDYEVTHSAGTFVKEVLGYNDDALQHSDRRRPRKFRATDE